MNEKKTLLGKIGIAILCLASPAWAIDLDGGTETFKFPEDIANQRACIVLTNDTRANICDFVVKVAGAPPFKLTSVNINDDNQAGENWDVDDDNSGSLEAGENDNAPPAASEKVRIEERGKDHCIARGRSVTLELQMDMNPRSCDEIKITPTGTGGGVLLVSALPACFEYDRLAVLFPTGEAVLLNDSTSAVFSLRVTLDQGISLVSMTSPSHGGTLNGNVFSLSNPFLQGQELQINFAMDGFRTDQDITKIAFTGITTRVPILPGLWGPLAVAIFALGGGGLLHMRRKGIGRSRNE